MTRLLGVVVGAFLFFLGKFISHEPIHEPIQRSSLGEVGLMKVPLHNQRPNDVSSSHSLASTQKEEKVVACSKALFAPSVRDISLAAAMGSWSHQSACTVGAVKDA